MNNTRQQKGFTLVTAIFLLVAVAGLMVYMVNLRVLQQSTVVMAVQGARALQAARSGIEYGIYRAFNSPNCSLADTTETVTFTQPSLAAFSVTVTCSASSHQESGPAFDVFQISALAEQGSLALGADANPDYVSRFLRVTVSNNPP